MPGSVAFVYLRWSFIRRIYGMRSPPAVGDFVVENGSVGMSYNRAELGEPAADHQRMGNSCSELSEL